MLEENKNLETESKKTGKSWLFRIGVGFIVLAIGLTIFFLKKCRDACDIVFALSLYYFFIPLVLIGIALILAHFFLKFRKKKGRTALFWKIIIALIVLVIARYELEMVLEVVGGSKALGPIYSKIGAITKNDFICSVPISRWNRAECYLETARHKEDPLVCGKIDFPSVDQLFQCYLDIARMTNNETVCEKSKSTEVKTRCYLETAQAKKDETLCEKLTYPRDKEDCYFEVAIVKDAALCQKITDFQRRNYCNLEAERLRLGDLSFCNSYSYTRFSSYYPTRRTDECLFEVALARNNSGFCENIKNSFKRSVCYETLE